MLITRTGEFIPGGFLFQDPRTGMTFKDGGFYSVVSQIQRHRQANPRLYPIDDGKWLDYDSICQELDDYSCLRLGNDPHWCSGGTPAPKNPKKVGYTVTMPTPCTQCGGTNGTEIVCATCGGRKVTGWKCVACGFIKGK